MRRYIGTRIWGACVVTSFGHFRSLGDNGMTAAAKHDRIGSSRETATVSYALQVAITAQSSLTSFVALIVADAADIVKA